MPEIGASAGLQFAGNGQQEGHSIRLSLSASHHDATEDYPSKYGYRRGDRRYSLPGGVTPLCPTSAEQTDPGNAGVLSPIASPQFAGSWGLPLSLIKAHGP